MLPYAPGNEDGFALVTVTPPLAARNETTPRDITLVLDVSGSMQGRKMEQARAAGRQLLGTLRPDDRFRLIDFSSDVRTFRDEFVSATSENLRDANRYLDALEAVGGTNIEGALREAMRPSPTDGRLPLVLFITDGEPTVGERDADRLAALGDDASARGSAHRADLHIRAGVRRQCRACSSNSPSRGAAPRSSFAPRNRSSAWLASSPIGSSIP